MDTSKIVGEKIKSLRENRNISTEELAQRSGLAVEQVERIENLSAYTERGRIRFNRAKKHSPDMQELRQQFLGFPDYPHDDGPDAVEGAVYKLNKPTFKQSKGIRAVKYTTNKKRRLW